MSTLPLGMIIESLVAGLLLVTISYCWILNRRLQRLRADEETLRATISELITATEIAERAILGLKATATDVDKTLGGRLSEAEAMSRLLAEQLGQGEQVLARISQIAEAARSAQATEAAARHVEPALRHAEVRASQASVAEPQRQAAVAAPVTARDIRAAAVEATARLERFRKRAGEAAA